MKCTIFEHLYTTKQPFYIPIGKALERIKEGKSKTKIEELRNCIDKERQDALKKQLPSICFSGTFSSRGENNLIDHSGYVILDFDNLNDVGEKAAELDSKDFIYARWLSPRGNGLKALVKIADGKKHRLHFAALQETFPDVDKSGSDPARVCFESYDPDLYINEKAKVFTKTLEYTKQVETNVLSNESEVFKRLLTWIANKGDSFKTGERNSFIFKLASACCRFGIHEDSAAQLISNEYPTSNDFTQKELNKAISSAYKRGNFSTAYFEQETLIDRKSLKEVHIEAEPFDPDAPAKDVIYGEYVKEQALNIFRYGYETVKGLNIPQLDLLFKEKKGELTGLTGIGNYGKSTYHKWRILMRMLMYGEKFATFAPEDNPPHEYYHDFVEMLLGDDCTPSNPYKPAIERYNNAYDFISKHLFYIYPKDLAPTPTYIKERFLELIIKEKISGVYLDPFNQMTHDYSSTGGRSDKYLETVLGDFGRFAQTNDIYFTIILHPHKLTKQANGNYPCPDVYELTDGAMWNNKLDNIQVYHRPLRQTDPLNPLCEIHSKKIRRQKTVGKIGVANIEYNYKKRRYEIDGVDYMGNFLRDNRIDFSKTN